MPVSACMCLPRHPTGAEESDSDCMCVCVTDWHIGGEEPDSDCIDLCLYVWLVPIQEVKNVTWLYVCLPCRFTGGEERDMIVCMSALSFHRR